MKETDPRSSMVSPPLNFSYGCFRPSRLQVAAIESLPVGVIGRVTELVPIPSSQGRMRIVSPHQLALGEV